MGTNQKTARSAGVLYLVIFVSGIFAQFFVRQSLIAPGDGATTVSNILASESLFRLGIAGDLLMLISDVALALLFYVLFKPVDNALSLMAALFRLTQAAIIGSSLVNLFYVLNLLGAANAATIWGAEQLYDQIMLYLDAHAIGYSIAMVFFGINCLIFGYLVFKSRYVPRILGVLLLIAGLAYLTDSFAQVLLTDYAAYKALFEAVAIPLAVIGEFATCLWLLVKGINVQTQARHVHLTAVQAESMGA